jgi:hypothetical protein
MGRRDYATRRARRSSGVDGARFSHVGGLRECLAGSKERGQFWREFIPVLRCGAEHSEFTRLFGEAFELADLKMSKRDCHAIGGPLCGF